MATAAGIAMNECRLLEEGGRAHFMTKRFDRAGDDRIHVSTLCAMAELDYRQLGTHDYSQLFATIDRLGLGPDARGEAFRRMVFNVAAANCDDHTKNHSFTMGPDGVWALSPAYDLTHSYRRDSPWVFQHAMSVNGVFLGATCDDFAEVADRFEVPAATRIVDDVLSAVSRWPEFAVAAGLDLGSPQVKAVSDDIESMTPR
jgi:serine/threonine-protein kinase HipA